MNKRFEELREDMNRCFEQADKCFNQIFWFLVSGFTVVSHFDIFDSYIQIKITKNIQLFSLTPLKLDIQFRCAGGNITQDSFCKDKAFEIGILAEDVFLEL